jgi:hypothetical protein
MSRSLLVTVLLALAVPAARADDAAPPAKKEAAPSRSRLSAWRAGAQPPAEVPPTTIVRAAVRKADRAAERRKARQPRDAIEIIWHAPGT